MTQPESDTPGGPKPSAQSGKATSIYNLLHQIDTPRAVSVTTIEAPTEFVKTDTNYIKTHEVLDSDATTLSFEAWARAQILSDETLAALHRSLKTNPSYVKIREVRDADASKKLVDQANARLDYQTRNKSGTTHPNP